MLPSMASVHRRRALVVAFALLFPREAATQGTPLGPEFRVNTYTTGGQFAPKIAADPAGNFVVVWQSEEDGSGYGVFGQRYASSGATLGSEFRVNTYTTGRQYRPAVAADAAGNFVVVWTSDQDGFYEGIYGQRFASSGLPVGLEFRVNTYATVFPMAPSIAADAAGGFAVTWAANDPMFFGVYARRYSSSGAPLGPEFRVNTYTTSVQYRSQVSSDPAGNFVLVWLSGDQDGSGGGIFAQRYASSGAPLGAEFRVNTFTSNHQSNPAVASDSGGNFVVVWHGTFPGTGYDIFGQRYSASGAPLGPEFRANTSATPTQMNPALAADSAGNFVIVWESNVQDGSVRGVYAQRYDSSGVPSGPEFRVNTFTTNNQWVSSVAAYPAGFVVVWASGSQDGSGSGIFAQRYGPIVPVELMDFRVD